MLTLRSSRMFLEKAANLHRWP